MELMPALRLGWLNGWIPLVILLLVEGGSLLAFPSEVVTRLFDRSGWSDKQKAFTVMGKIFSLACLVLLILTPLKLGSRLLVVGASIFAIGLVGLVLSMLSFRDTPMSEPVTRGLYRVSRHPQLVALFILFAGMCLAVGSWPALFALAISRALQHFGILAEEGACLAQYGDSYRAYLERVPRYLLLF